MIVFLFLFLVSVQENIGSTKKNAMIPFKVSLASESSVQCEGACTCRELVAEPLG